MVSVQLRYRESISSTHMRSQTSSTELRVETWSLTAALEKKLDAFHQWCLRRLSRLSYFRHVTNMEVLRLTCPTQLSTTLRDRRLRSFGHIARADSSTRGSYTCSSIHYFWTATRLETTSRSTTTNLASYDWTGLAAAQHLLGVSLATGSGSWTVEADSGNGYAQGWGVLLMMTNLIELLAVLSSVKYTT